MSHHHERRYSLAELRDHCLEHGHLTEAERLDSYLEITHQGTDSIRVSPIPRYRVDRAIERFLSRRAVENAALFLLAALSVAGMIRIARLA
jgi:hypothetical protein